MNMSRLSRVSAIVAGVALLAACTDQAPTPTGLGLAASRGLPFTEGLASPAWQETAAGLVAQAGFNPQTATHAYPLLGVAQYLAVQRAEAADGGTDVADVASGIGIGTGGRNRLELDRGAVAGASVVGVSGGAWRNPADRRYPNDRADRDRRLLGAERRYADHGRVLDPGRDRRHQPAQPVGARGDTPLRPAQRDDVRRADRLLGCE